MKSSTLPRVPPTSFSLPILPLIQHLLLTLPILRQRRRLVSQSRDPHHSSRDMAMSSKNWNDRADKDLFFTILSVKNIGVISGSEWATIGNHMRTLGYGFTNEGCR